MIVNIHYTSEMLQVQQLEFNFKCKSIKNYTIYTGKFS